MTQMSKNEIYYQASRDTVLYQNEVHQDFSGRAINLIGYGVAMLAATAIALNLPDDGVPWGWGTYIALGVLVCGFALLVSSCGYVLWPHRWEMGATVDSLAELVDDSTHDSDRVLGFLADSFKQSFVHNRTDLDKKTRAIYVATMALALEAAGLISVGVLLFVAIGLHQGSAGECIAPMG